MSYYISSAGNNLVLCVRPMTLIGARPVSDQSHAVDIVRRAAVIRRARARPADLHKYRPQAEHSPNIARTC